MGREVKRVPLSWDWPVGQTWQGYLMPESLHEAPCPAGDTCLNGETAARAWVGKVAYLLLMLDDDRSAQQRGRPMHPYFDSVPRPYGPPPTYDSNARPSADIAEFGAGLAGREGSLMGHDALDHWSTKEKVIRAAGLDPEVWGICPRCYGHATVEAYPGQRAEAEAWEKSEPPTGEGWQLWETVSEGSPISPVLPTAEALAQWIATPGNRDEMPYEAALRFVGEGWAPSFVGSPGEGVMGGAKWVGTR